MKQVYVETSVEHNKEENNVHVVNSESIPEINKSLKELKEISIILRQKLDTLESERNLMDVEYSQVIKLCFYCLV
jgi:hypothetical protein